MYLSLIDFSSFYPRKVTTLCSIEVIRNIFFFLLGSYTFYKECRNYRSCIYVVLIFLQSSVALMHFIRSVKSIAVVIRNLKSIVVVYTERKNFAPHSVALIFFIRNLESIAVVYTQRKSFIELYIAFIVCITNVGNIIAVYLKCKSFVRSNKHFKLPVLVKYIYQLLWKNFLFGRPLTPFTVGEDFFFELETKTTKL